MLEYSYIHILVHTFYEYIPRIAFKENRWLEERTRLLENYFFFITKKKRNPKLIELKRSEDIKKVHLITWCILGWILNKILLNDALLTVENL